MHDAHPLARWRTALIGGALLAWATVAVFTLASLGTPEGVSCGSYLGEIGAGGECGTAAGARHLWVALAVVVAIGLSVAAYVSTKAAAGCATSRAMVVLSVVLVVVVGLLGAYGAYRLGVGTDAVCGSPITATRYRALRDRCDTAWSNDTSIGGWTLVIGAVLMVAVADAAERARERMAGMAG